MENIVNIYGYGTPSNRFVRPLSQRSDEVKEDEKTEEEIAQAEREEEIMEQSMADAMGEAG